MVAAPQESEGSTITLTTHSQARQWMMNTHSDEWE
jgi:hypothetical protein